MIKNCQWHGVFKQYNHKPSNIQYFVMFKGKVVLMLGFCLLAVLIQTQDTNDDDATMVQIANIPGCRIWIDDVCQECSQGYYFNDEMICTMIDPQCMIFNSDLKVCEQCYTGYKLENEMCKITDVAVPEKIGCRAFQNQQCVQCSFRFYFDEEMICREVNPLCRTWDQANGDCLSCYAGFQLEDGKCVLLNEATLSAANPLCSIFQDSLCTKCSRRSYFNNDGVCTRISTLCKTYDNLNGVCLSCYEGYDLYNGGNCRWSPENQFAPPYIGCRNYDEEAQMCLQCNNGFRKIDDICYLVGQYCTQRNSDGYCTECISGYEVDEEVGECIWSPPESGAPGVNDPGCNAFQDNVCVQCSFRFYFDDNGICRKVSDFCQTWNDENGDCTSCYRGYTLMGRRCEVQQQIIQRINSEMNEENGGGVQFASGDSGSGGSGIQIIIDSDGNSIEDRTLSDGGIDGENGASSDASPEVSGSSGDGLDLQRSNPLCRRFDDNDEFCVDCSPRSYFRDDGICVEVDPLCKTYSKDNGTCTMCYEGYDLMEGDCRWSPENKFAPPYIGCRVFNALQQRCERCNDAFQFRGSICYLRADYCAMREPNNDCSECIQGYELDEEKKECVWSPPEGGAPGVNDPGCRAFNDNECVECSFRFYFDDNMICRKVSDLCMDWDEENGDCTTCYVGYELMDGKCYPQTLAQIDAGCSVFDWDSFTCETCSFRFYKDGDKCKQVDDLCRDYSKDEGFCTSCFGGYILDGGKCVIGDPLCKVELEEGGCTDCFVGYVLEGDKCVMMEEEMETEDENGG